MRALGLLLPLVAALSAFDSQPVPPNNSTQTGIVRGHVVDRAGKPVASALVRATRIDLSTGIVNATAEARSDSQGAFAIPRCPAGRLVVSAEHPRFNPGYAEATVDPRSPVQVQIVLQRGGRIVG